MKWLLTTCAAPAMSPFSTVEKRPPLGVGFLISVLRQAGHQVRFLDNYLAPTGFLESDYLRENRIEAVGIYVNTICLPDFFRMADRLARLRREGRWKGLVAVGGPHPSLLPETMPELVDHIALGEGEQAILAITEGKAGRIVRGPVLEDLDSLPGPAWDEFVKLPYDWSSPWIETRPLFALNTSRGCPFQCSFCSVSAVWGRRYRCFSADWMVAQVKELMARYGCRGVYFREDNFTVNQKRVAAFCEALLSQGLKLQWICETRVDTLDRELILLMRRAGCGAFYLGVESGSQRLLDLMQKGITVEQIEAAFAWCREAGVRTHASFLVGLPGETPADLEATRALRERIQPDYAVNNVFVGIPRSPCYDEVMAEKLYTYLDERGLAYLEGHDARVDQYYGGEESFKIPYPFRRRLVQSRQALECGQRGRALREAGQALRLDPGYGKSWRQLAKSALPKAGVTLVRSLRASVVLRPWPALFREWLRFGLRRPPSDHEFCVVSAQSNAGEAVIQCLDSVYSQRYPRRLVHHLLFDDASTDGTDAMILAWLERHPDHRVTYRRNPERLGLMANNLAGFAAALPGTIVLELNGDDWLADRGVIRFLNRVYADPNIWMTYNSFRYFQDGRLENPSGIPEIPAEVIRNNSFREHPWLSSHPQSFRAELFSHLRRESLIDPATGAYWASAVDQACYLPMLELAGAHSLGIKRILYIYNFRKTSHGRKDPGPQTKNSRRLRRLPKYQPLEKLESPAPAERAGEK